MGEIAARRIVKDNQKKIVENLIEGKIMFEDPSSNPYSSSIILRISTTTVLVIGSSN